MKCHNMKTEVLFRGRDIRLILLLGSYAVEEQVQISNALKKAQNAAPFLKNTLDAFDQCFRRIEVRLEEFMAIWKDDLHYDKIVLDELGSEVLDFDVEDFMVLDKLWHKLWAIMQNTSLRQQLPGHEHGLKLVMGGR